MVVATDVVSLYTPFDVGLGVAEGASAEERRRVVVHADNRWDAGRAHAHQIK